MRLTNFTNEKLRSRVYWERNLLHLALLVDGDDVFLLNHSRLLKILTRDCARLCARSSTISTIYFNLNIFSEQESLSLFRFRKHKIGTVADTLGWTACRTMRNRYKCDVITAGCIVLRRMASPCRWSDVEFMFGMHSSCMSEVFWEVLQTFVQLRGHLLETLRPDLIIERAELYSAAIHQEGAPLENCIGFLDCTKIQNSRRGGAATNQRVCYSGHKRFHSLIYQTISTPGRLMFYLYGPEVGRRHDMTLYRKSGLNVSLQQNMVVNEKQYCLYADASYVIRVYLQVAFPRASVAPTQIVYSALTSAVREAVEWTHKDLKQTWSSQDFKR